MLSYWREKLIEVRNSNFLKITGLINTMFKPSEVQKRNRLHIYNTPPVPTLQYGSENWRMKTKNKNRITATEMRLMRQTAK